MNKHIENAIEQHEKFGIQFGETLNWHLCYGVVHSDSNCLYLCFYSHHSEPKQRVSESIADTVFISYARGNFWNKLDQVKRNCKFVAFERFFKGSNKLSVYDIERLNNKIK
jgi:hypothetical protein